MTYTELLEKALKTMNRADVALGRMMDIVEEQTGRFPAWSDEVPAWILENFGYGYLDRPVSDYQLHGFLTAEALEEAETWSTTDES